MKETLSTALKHLRLSGMAKTLDIRLEEAASSRLCHAEFLEIVLKDEMYVRKDRLVARRTKAAVFRDQRTLEDFDWQFNPSIKKKAIYDLAACRFIEEGKDVLLLGPPGVGKSHLAQAVGLCAIRLGYLVLYRSIFDAVREFLQDEALAGSDRTFLRLWKSPKS